MFVSLFTSMVSAPFIAYTEMRFILEYLVFPLPAPPHYSFLSETIVVELRGR